jgi:hypothetical protein
VNETEAKVFYPFEPVFFEIDVVVVVEVVDADDSVAAFEQCFSDSGAYEASRACEKNHFRHKQQIYQLYTLKSIPVLRREMSPGFGGPGRDCKSDTSGKAGGLKTVNRSKRLKALGPPKGGNYSSKMVN